MLGLGILTLICKIAHLRKVWVRVHGLPQEYWRPKILFAIASSAGTPICTDAASAKPMIERTFGQFARVLVDMDVTQTLRYKVFVERKNYAFFVDLDYENIPEFCNHCRKIGHNIDYCKFLRIPEVKEGAEGRKKNAQAPTKDIWQEKSRVNWHLNGDRNTKFFYQVTKIKNKTKVVSSLRNDEEIVTDPNIISNHIVNYYSNLFSTNSFLQDDSLVEEVIPSLIDENTNNLLTMIPTEDEIKSTVFGKNGEGAPGPDGFGACFFQNYWSIVHKEAS